MENLTQPVTVVEKPELVFKGTIRQLAEAMKMEYAQVQGLVKFLAVQGKAKVIDRVPAAGQGKGKADLWEISKKIEINLP